MPRHVIYSETKLRSLVKSMTFRVLIISSDFLVVLFITGQIAESLGIILLTNLASAIIYYFHERAWDATQWMITPTGYDKPSRSITKAITFRVFVLMSDFFIINQIIKNALGAVEIVLFTNVVSTALYYVHERIWNTIWWGIVKVKNEF